MQEDLSSSPAPKKKKKKKKGLSTLTLNLLPLQLSGKREFKCFKVICKSECNEMQHFAVYRLRQERIISDTDGKGINI
jgi:hypothetical protein